MPHVDGPCELAPRDSNPLSKRRRASVMLLSGFQGLVWVLGFRERQGLGFRGLRVRRVSGFRALGLRV